MTNMERALTSSARGNDGYRIGSKILARLIQLQFFVICFVTALLLYNVFQGKPENRFWAVSFNNVRRPLVALREPKLDDEIILVWSAQAMTQIMTFGFNNMNQRFGAAQSLFSDVGWESFLNMLRKTGVIKEVLNNQLILTSIVSGEIKITYNGFRKGQYIWDVTVPLVITASAGNSERTVRKTVYATVVKVPTRKNPSGIGIEGFILY